MLQVCRSPSLCHDMFQPDLFFALHRKRFCNAFELLCTSLDASQHSIETLSSLLQPILDGRECELCNKCISVRVQVKQTPTRKTINWHPLSRNGRASFASLRDRRFLFVPAPFPVLFRSSSKADAWLSCLLPTMHAALMWFCFFLSVTDVFFSFPQRPQRPSLHSC